MGSISYEKAHAVCVPFPTQGHINPMLQVAKLLHTRGFHITFVLTDFNRRRLLRSSGQQAVEGLPDFQFETIADGLPFSDEDATQDLAALSDSTRKNCLPHFRRLLAKLNEEDGAFIRPPVSCIVSDGAMSFTLDAAKELGVPNVFFWTTSACGFLAYYYYRHLVDRGLTPLKDAADMSNGFLDTEVDWAEGLTPGMRLKDFPAFIRTTDANDILLNFFIRETSRASRASAILLNTFHDLEKPAIAALSKLLPPIYPIGPLSLLTRNQISAQSPLAAIDLSLWHKDDSCLSWLDARDPNSVVYVNFGSITVLSKEQLTEFACGLANSGFDFLWMIRPDMVRGESSALPLGFVGGTKGRGFVASWCAQEEVLVHPSVGVFLTHCGWNSTVESIAGGVPMICWPCFDEQHTNCRYACGEWGSGVEIGGGARREDVEGFIREMMAGEVGKGRREKAVEWKEVAAKAARPDGVSAVSFEKMVDEVLRSNNKGLKSKIVPDY